MKTSYSHRDITDKLGLKPGQAVRVVGKGDPVLLARVKEKTGRGFVTAKKPFTGFLHRCIPRATSPRDTAANLR